METTMTILHIELDGTEVPHNSGGSIFRFRIIEHSSSLPRTVRTTISLPVEPGPDGLSGLYARAHDELALCFDALSRELRAYADAYRRDGPG
jgi:hypothetical protein